MENIINSVKNLIGTYGFGAATIIVLTIVIVNLIKKPILRRAEKLARERGCDKAVVTRYVTYLPIAVSLVLTIFWQLFASGFDVVGMDWGGLVSSAVLYAAVSIATYESVKVSLRAYASKKNADGTANSATGATSATDGSGENGDDAARSFKQNETTPETGTAAQTHPVSESPRTEAGETSADTGEANGEATAAAAPFVFLPKDTE